MRLICWNNRLKSVVSVSALPVMRWRNAAEGCGEGGLSLVGFGVWSFEVLLYSVAILHTVGSIIQLTISSSIPPGG